MGVGIGDAAGAFRTPSVMTQSSDQEHHTRNSIKPQPRGIERTNTPGIAARPIDAPRPATKYAPIEPEHQAAPITPQSTTAAPAPQESAAEDAHDEDAPAPRRPWTRGEKLTSVALLALVVLCGALLAPGWLAPADAEPRMVDEPALPIQHGGLTLTAAEADWVTLQPTDKATHWHPRLELEVAPGSSGVLRVFFYSVNGLQQGDTLNFTVEDGRFTDSGSARLTTLSTQGLESILLVKDIQVRGDEFWSVRVMSGPSARAGIDEFSELMHLRIPWDIAAAAAK